MKPLTKWNAVLDRSADIPRVFRNAFEAMTTGRAGSAHIALPFDVQNGPVDRADLWGDATLGRVPARRVAPDADAIVRAARLLRGARPAGGHRIECGAEHARNIGRAVEHGVPFGRRPHQRALVDFGQRVAAARGDRYVARDAQKRHRGFVRFDDARLRPT